VIEALLFDLDDTLYLESDFVASGYRAVARFIGARRGMGHEEILYTMMRTFTAHGRRAVLPRVIDRYLDASVTVADLVEIYRNHGPRIRLLPGYGPLLRRLGRRHRLGILTDGLPEVQERKVTALGLGKIVDDVVYTWKQGPERQKPDPAGFLALLERFGTDPARALYVGDNPDKDCAGAHRAGMKFVQVAGRQVRPGPTREGGAAEFVIENLHQLPGVLALLEGAAGERTRAARRSGPRRTRDAATQRTSAERRLMEAVV